MFTTFIPLGSMKYMFALSLCWCSLIPSAKSQVLINDAGFANALGELVPNAMSGNVLDETHPDVLALNSMLLYNQGIADLSGIEYFTGLDTLKCFYNYMDTIPALPPDLVYLDCSNNSLTALPPLPSTLRYLSCSRNQILEIAALPPLLEFLDVGRTEITEVPALPEGLIQLYVYYTGITSLPALPSTLERLTCVQNYDLHELPLLPNGLQWLDCSDNRLYTLPQLPAALTFLRCYSNMVLTALPALPAGLRYLECSSNPITMLPPLPSSLERLVTPYCDLTALPVLPVGLDTLDCRGNELTALPVVLPPGLKMLSVSQNEMLTTLPVLPMELEWLIASNCPALTCLPALPDGLRSLSVHYSGVECLPNLPTGLAAYPGNLGIAPIICRPELSECPLFQPVVTGTTFRDDDGDGTHDANEPVITSTPVNTEPGGLITVTDNTGFYAQPLGLGTYSVQGSPLPYHTLSTPATVVTTSAMDDAISGVDVGYAPIPGIHDLVVDVDGIAVRPGFESIVYLQVRNVGTEATSAAVQLAVDQAMDWVSSTVVPDDLVDGNAEWSLAILEPGQVWNAAVTLVAPVNLPMGSSVVHVFSAFPSEQDTTVLDNTDTYNVIVTGSFDPNDKLADPPILLPNEVADGRPITYTIRFQNTGTAAAERVVITDTLSTDLQWNTMRMLHSSHAYTWYMTDGVLHFVFDPIHLPDSGANEPASHGFVKFEILPRNTMVIGEGVANSANIYFDFNQPVITDTVFVPVALPTLVAQVLDRSSTTLFPNPVQDQLQFTWSRHHVGSPMVEVFAPDGRLVSRSRIVRSGLDVAHFSPGHYTARLLFDDGSREVIRFVKY